MTSTKSFLSFLLLSFFSIQILLGQEITQVAGTASLESTKKKTASLTVAMTQTSGPNPVTTAGQIITYKIIVTNTGTEKIKGVVLTETYPGTGTGNLSPARESDSNNGVLNEGETWRYTATYRVTQADINTKTNLVNTISVVTIQVPGPTIATATTLVVPQILPTFTQIGPLCRNSTPPSLPTSSNNTPAITGKWNPATISTATAGIRTYTFTPTAGQFASTATMNIVVTPQMIPTFTQIGPLCRNITPPSLPTSSNNTPAIIGTWSPATISTATVGTTTYTFTPTLGQCAAVRTMNIVVTNSFTPTFTQIGPLCQGSTAPALPATSNNKPAISGTWSPATISTSTVGTTTYTFTPSGGHCVMTTTLMVIVNSLPTVSFTTQPGANSSIGVEVTYTTQPGMTNYVWGFPGTSGVDYSITSGGTVGDNAVVLKYLTPGNKIVTINYTSGGCTAASSTSSTATAVNALPTATITTVTVSDATYDGNPHGGTAVVTGAGGLNQSLTVMYVGTGSTDYPSSSVVPTNAGTYSASAIYDGSANYLGSSDSKTFTIAKAASNVSVTGGTFPYDAAAHAATAFAYGIGGINDVISREVIFSYIGTGITTYGPSATAPTNAGTYSVTANFAGNSNYYSSTNTASITIGKMIVGVSAEAKTKIYGQIDPALNYKVTTGNLLNDDDFSGHLTRDDGENVGTYAIGKGTLALSSNYTLTYVGADLTITPLPVAVFAVPKTKVYGDRDPALTFISVLPIGTVLSNGQVISFTGSLSRGPGEVVLGSPYAINQGSLANSNYIIAFVGSDLTITPLPVTVTAEAKTKVYGQVDNALTYLITPGKLINGDTFSGSLIRDDGENVGTYAIGKGTLALSSNYTLTFVGANFTITPLPVNVFAVPKAKVYGEIDPELTFVSVPEVGTQLANGKVISFIGSLSREPGEDVAGSPYFIDQGSLDNSNYILTYKRANLTITPLPVTVLADNQNKGMWQIDPPLTFLSSPAVGAVLANGQVISFTGRLSRDEGENPGFYAINQESLANSNYIITYLLGYLRIKLYTAEELPRMAIFKRQTAGPYPVTAPEQVITYQIVLTNDGDRPLSNIVPTEIYPGNGAGTLSPPTESISNNNILNVGESWTYTATYTVTAADITAGTDLVNTISVVTDWIPAPTIFKATTPVAGTASLTSRNVNLTSSRAADVNPVLQGEFGLKAYPNPFTDNVYFDLQLKTDSKVRLEIFNIDGTKLSTIYDDCVVAFNHYELEYKPKNFSSGMLIYRLIVDGKLMFTGKLIHK